MRLRQKQLALLRVIARGNDDGSPVDLDQLIERAPHKPSKESVQFSIRALVKHGLVEKQTLERRRERARRIIAATPLGMHFAHILKPNKAFVVTEEEDEIDAELEAIGAAVVDGF